MFFHHTQKLYQYDFTFVGAPTRVDKWQDSMEEDDENSQGVVDEEVERIYV